MQEQLVIRQLQTCNRNMFGDMILKYQQTVKSDVSLQVPSSKCVFQPVNITKSKNYNEDFRLKSSDPIPTKNRNKKNTDVSFLMNQLLFNIYTNLKSTPTATTDESQSTISTKSTASSFKVDTVNLKTKSIESLKVTVECLEWHIQYMSRVLVRELRRRDALRRQQDAQCDVITIHLQKFQDDGRQSAHFTIQPTITESGFEQWTTAMRMVVQLPGGIPAEFRRTMWLSLADRHLVSKGVVWSSVEKRCFSEVPHPADTELGIQIVKDLHRTGCSLFCGEDGLKNQAHLKRVLLAYARWNKTVGYCQGFNMLAALILQVTDKCETEALKLMIYLIEGVLPESYFTDNLRGLSVDMAVFRELLRTRLPQLSRHLDTLQIAAKEGTSSYEPPLTNVFTMQWFLTLFCNCLPHATVLRVWDLILLEGNEILLRTALAIWKILTDRIMVVNSADEFYCVMGGLMRDFLEYSILDANYLIKTVIGIAPLTELSNLREQYMYNINPWGSNLNITNRLYASSKQLEVYPAKDRLILDISILKKQYEKLRERQRQAHIIFNAAISRQTGTSSIAVNHLLLGGQKSIAAPLSSLDSKPAGTTLLWKDAEPRKLSSSSSSDTELCDDPDPEILPSSDDEEPNSRIAPDELDNPNAQSLMMNVTDDNTETLQTTDVVTPVENIFDKTISFVSDISSECSNLQLGSNPNLYGNDAEDDDDDDDDEEEEDDDDDEDEDDDSSSDFDSFLEDRLRAFSTKAKSPPLPEICDSKRLQHSRKNSEKALEIIQENSMILQRIISQTRVSPVNYSNPSSGIQENTDNSSGTSMPTLVDSEIVKSTIHELESKEEVSQDFNLLRFDEESPDPLLLEELEPNRRSPSPHNILDESITFDLSSLPIESLQEMEINEPYSGNSDSQFASITNADSQLLCESDDYGSRYTKILQKSKDLSEKFNSLIVNSSTLKFIKKEPQQRSDPENDTSSSTGIYLTNSITSSNVDSTTMDHSDCTTLSNLSSTINTNQNCQKRNS